MNVDHKTHTGFGNGSVVRAASWNRDWVLMRAWGEAPGKPQAMNSHLISQSCWVLLLRPSHVAYANSSGHCQYLPRMEFCIWGWRREGGRNTKKGGGGDRDMYKLREQDTKNKCRVGLIEELRARPKHRCRVNQDSTHTWIWFLGQRTGIFLGTVPQRVEEEAGSEMEEAALLGAISCSQRECRQTVSASSVAHAHGIPAQCRHIPPLSCCWQDVYKFSERKMWSFILPRCKAWH